MNEGIKEVSQARVLAGRQGKGIVRIGKDKGSRKTTENVVL